LLDTAAAAPASAATAAAAPAAVLLSADVSAVDVTTLRAGTLGALNAYRAGLGLGAVGRDGRLDAKAQAWADHMARTGSFVHNPDLSYPAGLGGNSEIILKAGVDNGSPEVAVRAWAGSAPHQRVMATREMTLAGIGVARVGRDVYYVVNFGYPVAAPPMTFRRGATQVQVGGAILDTYRAAGLDRGVVGWPVTGEYPVPGGRGQAFDRASIYWSPATGAHVVRGAIRDRWASMGWEGGWLGFPTSSEFGVRGGAVQRFAGGLVYYSPATGAQALRGAILDAYGRTGFENGRLGFPVTGEVALRGGAYAAFQGGSIYWSRATGAHVVLGAVREAWGRAGWETGRLGWPRSGEYAVPGGVRQDFTGGSLTYTWATGTVTETR
ncbi:CAP domain-containing protein, partial [Kineococcus glutinatus]|uniref:CAP domain-containing protein n=1 Tax=Kineococcus glutinatus TaxID=1070872 RepID=UPI0031E76CEA